MNYFSSQIVIVLGQSLSFLRWTFLFAAAAVRLNHFLISDWNTWKDERDYANVRDGDYTARDRLYEDNERFFRAMHLEYVTWFGRNRALWERAHAVFMEVTIN